MRHMTWLKVYTSTFWVREVGQGTRVPFLPSSRELLLWRERLMGLATPSTSRLSQKLEKLWWVV